MQNLKVTLAQVNQVWEDKSANLRHFDAVFNKIESSDLILFPEMFHTGFSMNSKLLAEDFTKSEGIDWLRNKAIKHNTAIYTSLIIKESGKIYNRGVFIFPSGEIEVYDKRKLFAMAKEDEFYSAGKEKKIVSYKGWNIQLQICYDLRFPEISRNYMTEDNNPAYDLLLYVANWPQIRIAHWDNLLLARAIENQAFVLAVNRVGKDGKGIDYNGSSQIIDALGEVIFKAKNDEESLITIELSAEKLNETRRKLPFLKDASV